MSENRWLFDHDALESALERFVLLDVFLVILERGGADAAEVPTRERTLQHVGGVEAAFDIAGADNGVELVDEKDDAPLRREDLVLDGLEPFFELTAKLGARDHFAHLEKQDALIGERVGNFGAHDALGETFDDDRLADAGLADEHRVVFFPAQQDLDEAVDLFLTTDDGVERAFAGELGEVRRVLFERLEFCVAALIVDGAASTLPEIGIFRALVSETEVAQDARREIRGLAMEC